MNSVQSDEIFGVICDRFSVNMADIFSNNLFILLKSYAVVLTKVLKIENNSSHTLYVNSLASPRNSSPFVLLVNLSSI